MSWICHFLRREIARRSVENLPIDPASKLGRHIRKCACCRGYSEDIENLTRGLHSSFEALETSEDFVESVITRLALAPPRITVGQRTPLTLTLSFGFAFMLMIAVAVKVGLQKDRYSLGTSTTKFVDGMNQRQVDYIGALLKKTNEPGTKQSSTEYSYKTRPLDFETARIVRHIRRNHRGSIYTVNYFPAKVKSEPYSQDREEGSKPTWREVGMVYEAQGDHDLAEQAYSKSYQEHPTPEVAYDIGREAERQGNVADAMDIYADLLARNTDENTQTPQ